MIFMEVESMKKPKFGYAPYPTYAPKPVTSSDVGSHDEHVARGVGMTPDCRLCRAVSEVE